MADVKRSGSQPGRGINEMVYGRICKEAVDIRRTLELLIGELCMSRENENKCRNVLIHGNFVDFEAPGLPIVSSWREILGKLAIVSNRICFLRGAVSTSLFKGLQLVPSPNINPELAIHRICQNFSTLGHY